MLAIYTRHIQSLMPVPLELEIIRNALVHYRKGAVIFPTWRVHKSFRTGEVVG